MISCLTINLTAVNKIAAQPRSYTGYLVRGLIYTLLRSSNPELAERLHQEKGSPASFSIKPPHSLQEKLHLYHREIPENVYFTVTATFLREDLPQILCHSLLNLQGEIPLGFGKATINEILLQQITPQHLQEAEAVEKFSIQFITPTFFRVHIPKAVRKTEQVRVLPLPDPLHLFTNLYNIWNSYLKPRISEEYLEWLQQHPILISRLRNIKTHCYYEHPVKGVFAIGFTGTAYYTLAEDTYDKKMAKITHQLLKMAEYTNVGGNRTAGYGWITYRAKPPEEEK